MCLHTRNFKTCQMKIAYAINLIICFIVSVERSISGSGIFNFISIDEVLKGVFPGGKTSLHSPHITSVDVNVYRSADWSQSYLSQLLLQLMK
jgi:hypothetical protein